MALVRWMQIPSLWNMIQNNRSERILYWKPEESSHETKPSFAKTCQAVRLYLDQYVLQQYVVILTASSCPDWLSRCNSLDKISSLLMMQHVEPQTPPETLCSRASPAPLSRSVHTIPLASLPLFLVAFKMRLICCLYVRPAYWRWVTNNQVSSLVLRKTVYFINNGQDPCDVKCHGIWVLVCVGVRVDTLFLGTWCRSPLK